MTTNYINYCSNPNLCNTILLQSHIQQGLPVSEIDTVPEGETTKTIVTNKNTLPKYEGDAESDIDRDIDKLGQQQQQKHKQYTKSRSTSVDDEPFR